MFTKAAAGTVNTRGVPGRGKGVRFGRRGSRMSGLPEVFGELPVACLAEETETPGDGQVCALVTIAGNRRSRTRTAGASRRRSRRSSSW